MGVFDKIGGVFKRDAGELEISDDYVELEADVTGSKAKITIRPFTLDSFDSVKPVLDALREGYTIALINMGPLREKDSVTLKRAIDKIKKTLDANEGDIAGVGDNWLIATPSFATVFRGGSETEEIPKTQVFE
ncbi:cell division protein SepF [Candidatus Woesearchaeota archaeon]|jgi:SepF-like predicted cell division protein (DUF552 family)|nr:cell division protein SepF [Candidatus Woesearchaeota archaeon]MBT4114036.1 cell division protein SepF [Candidatus Woesearchaeota archaeon]MBT4248107.1 cell division protein SepF [Candidatus Woesearchaeota archaeon]